MAMNGCAERELLWWMARATIPAHSAFAKDQNCESPLATSPRFRPVQHLQTFADHRLVGRQLLS